MCPKRLRKVWNAKKTHFPDMRFPVWSSLFRQVQIARYLTMSEVWPFREKEFQSQTLDFWGFCGTLDTISITTIWLGYVYCRPRYGKQNLPKCYGCPIFKIIEILTACGGSNFKRRSLYFQFCRTLYALSIREIALRYLYHWPRYSKPNLTKIAKTRKIGLFRRPVAKPRKGMSKICVSIFFILNLCTARNRKNFST